MFLAAFNIFKSKEAILKSAVQSISPTGEWNLVYKGPFNSKIRLLKYGSVATFVSSIALSVFAGLGTIYEIQKSSSLPILDNINTQVELENQNNNDKLSVNSQSRINKICAVSLGGKE